MSAGMAKPKAGHRGPVSCKVTVVHSYGLCCLWSPCVEQDMS